MSNPAIQLQTGFPGAREMGEVGFYSCTSEITHQGFAKPKMTLYRDVT